MSKKNSVQMPIRERIEAPKVEKDDKGNVTVMCPFCNPSHPLGVENNSSCGTIIQIRAVQTIYKAKYDRRMICVKCTQGGGEMVRFQNGFVHTHDCAPGVVTLEKPPAFSKLAQRVHGMKPAMKKIFESIYGEAIPVHEVFPDGKRTGETIGYFFKKRGMNGSNKTGQRKESVPSG